MQPPPEVPEWAHIYTQAWDVLRSDRNLSQGIVGKIFYSSISQYARDIGLTGESFHLFVKFVSALDEEYVAVAYERMKQQAENPDP